MAAPLHAYNEAEITIPVEVVQQIQRLRTIPIKPDTLYLCLGEFEVQFNIDLSDYKLCLKPSSVFQNRIRTADYKGYESSKLTLDLLNLTEKLHTRARLDLAEFFGV